MSFGQAQSDGIDRTLEPPDGSKPRPPTLLAPFHEKASFRFGQDAEWSTKVGLAEGQLRQKVVQTPIFYAQDGPQHRPDWAWPGVLSCHGRKRPCSAPTGRTTGIGDKSFGVLAGRWESTMLQKAVASSWEANETRKEAQADKKHRKANRRPASATNPQRPASATDIRRPSSATNLGNVRRRPSTASLGGTTRERPTSSKPKGNKAAAMVAAQAAAAKAAAAKRPNSAPVHPRDADLQENKEDGQIIQTQRKVAKNDEQADVFEGWPEPHLEGKPDGTGQFYCGRGRGMDENERMMYCGPHSGSQCDSCLRFMSYQAPIYQGQVCQCGHPFDRGMAQATAMTRCTKCGNSRPLKLFKSEEFKRNSVAFNQFYSDTVAGGKTLQETLPAWHPSTNPLLKYTLSLEGKTAAKAMKAINTPLIQRPPLRPMSAGGAQMELENRDTSNEVHADQDTSTMLIIANYPSLNQTFSKRVMPPGVKQPLNTHDISSWTPGRFMSWVSATHQRRSFWPLDPSAQAEEIFSKTKEPNSPKINMHA